MNSWIRGVALALVLIVPSFHGAMAAEPLPLLAPNVVLTSTATVQTFNIDLYTLPLRPRLIVEVTPPPTHSNMQIQIEATNWVMQGGYTFVCPPSIFSTSGPGLATLSINLFACGSGPHAFDEYPGVTAEIHIRAVSFGSSTGPATVSVAMRGETRPPTGEMVQRIDPPNVPQAISLIASKDTVLYEELPNADNGLGEFLWAGRNVVSNFEDLTLSNGWLNAPFGTRNAAVSLTDGIVYFKGAVHAGTSDVLFTLPPSMRPSTDVYVAVDLCNAAPGRLWIRPSGEVSVSSSTTFADAQCFTSLEGASFAPSMIGFTALTLSNGWVNAPFATSNAAASIIDGIVHLKGAIASGTAAVAFTLPTSMRPATNVYVPVGLCFARKGRLFIQPSGVVSIEFPSSLGDAQCFTSLDGASFALSATGFTALTLSNGWVNAPFATSNASASIIDGIVHLKGAIASGTAAVAFTLPTSMRPPTNVYVPVDLCGARKGRLLIQPSGVVNVQSQGAFGDAQCFTSLDGASFASFAIQLSSYARHSLVAFDVGSAIPPSALVDSARLDLEVTGTLQQDVPYPLRIHRVAPASDPSWEEGLENADSDEFVASPVGFAGATWLYRNRPFGTWSIPGGAPMGAPIVDGTVDSPGGYSFFDPGLRTAVQNMVTYGGGADGFVLVAPPPQSLFGDEGIQIASRNSPRPPTLVAQFTPTEIYESGEAPTGAISFIDDGQNLRWIYDVERDNVFVTKVGGICQASPNSATPYILPYTYRFEGTPGFTGVDCCTWQIDSTTGVTGTGQALFFHNVDPATSMPPDSDDDGIRNGCDNCPSTPNGPFRGTCLARNYDEPCRSNQECGGGGVICSLSQEFVGICQSGSYDVLCGSNQDCGAGVICLIRQDGNGTPVGSACPEPGVATALASGLALMAWRARRPGRGRAMDI